MPQLHYAKTTVYSRSERVTSVVTRPIQAENKKNEKTVLFAKNTAENGTNSPMITKIYMILSQGSLSIAGKFRSRPAMVRVALLAWCVKGEKEPMPKL